MSLHVYWQLKNYQVSESPQEKKASSPTKKRKLEEDDEKPAAKIPKRDEAEPAEMKDLSDYVVVNKDDVPAADSKEVKFLSFTF